MTYIQSLIDNYYRLTNDTLSGLIGTLIFLFLIVIAIAQGVKALRSPYSLWEKFLLSIAVIIVGWMLSQTGLIPYINITYAHFDILISLAIIGFLMIYLITLCCKYKKIMGVLANNIKYLQYAVYFCLFLLISINTLRIWEYLIGLSLILIFEVIGQICTCVNQKKESVEAARLPESDWPNLALYPSRELQLKKFIPILQQSTSEPYAIMISGAWGDGKTSFVKALEADSSFSNDTFIWIEAGGEKSASDIMLDISEKIIAVLKANNKYLEKADAINQYFQTFSGILDETNWKIFNKIGTLFNTDTEFEDTKKYLNRKLASLKFKIYLIVDDLDRCDEEYRAKMFKVIRESTQLTNCKTIFLADRNSFLNETCGNHYIEKYISYNLELCPVVYEEIVHYYFDIIFNDDYISGIRQQIWHSRDSAMLRKELLELPRQIINALNEEAAPQKESNDPDPLHDAITIIETDTTNSRKVKNFLKGIKADITNLNTAWNDSSVNNYLEEDWISKIIRVQFLKHFFPDYYWNIHSCYRIEKYHDTQSKWVKKLLLGIPNSLQTPLSDKTTDIINLCMYKLDLLDFEKDKTVEQSYLDELRGDSPDISHVEHYLSYATPTDGYSDYQKILTLYQKQDAGISLYQKRILVNDFLNKISQIYISDLSAFSRLSDDIISFLKDCPLSSSDIYTCKQRGKAIIANCLECNSETLKIPLKAVFGLKFFDRETEDFHPVDFNHFYHLLQNIEGNAIHIDTNAHNDIEMVKQYYEQLERQMQELSYADLYPHIQNDFEKCRQLFEICRLWYNIETSLQPQTSNNAALMKYFSLDPLIFTQNTFQNMASLKEALHLLEEYYQSMGHKNQYTSDLSLLFSRTVTNMLRLCKTNPTWRSQIRKEAVEMEARIRRIAEIVYKLDQAKTEQSRNVITQIRIMVFTFRKWVREAE